MGGRTCLGNAEVGEDKAASAGRAPDEKHLDFKASRACLLVDKVWGWKSGVRSRYVRTMSISNLLA